VQSAAVAMLCGHGDPLAVLALNHEDWLIMTAVSRRAVAMDAERRKAEIKATAEWTGIKVAESVGRMMR